MTIADTTKIAIQSIFRNKGRAFLTMLGIIIGVASVVMLTSIGTGLQIYIEQQFEQFGSNIVYVVPGNPFGEGGGFGNPETAIIERTKKTLTTRMARDIKRQLRSSVINAIPITLQAGKASFKETEKNVTFLATSPDYETVFNTKAEKGQWYTSADEESSKRVVVIGPNLAKELFGSVDPVSKRIQINSATFEVVGVLEEKGGGGFGGPSFDDYGYIPFSTGGKLFNNEVVNEIGVLVRDKETISQTVKEIENLLLKDLDEDEFTVFEQTQILNTINSILGVLTAGLGGIAAISLVVGGIGIMNIMLVTVTERTREIGLRKALGATPNQIMLQFLIESATLSVIGGMIGVVIAYLGSLAIQNFFPAAVTIQAVLLAFGVSGAVGIVFGIAPARNASKLSPIEALRSE